MTYRIEIRICDSKRKSVWMFASKKYKTMGSMFRALEVFNGRDSIVTHRIGDKIDEFWFEYRPIHFY